MTEQNPQTNNSKKRRNILWLVVILLIILVAATVAAASGFFSQFTKSEDTVISLDKGSVDKEDQVNDQNEGTDADEEAALSDAGSTADGIVNSNSAVRSTAKKTTPAKAKKFGFQVSDDKQVWSTDTQIDIFKASYDNETGEITVQSAGADGQANTANGTTANGKASGKASDKTSSKTGKTANTGIDKLIAPGTSNQYTFAVKNTGQKKADYKIWVETRIAGSVKTLPLQTRMAGRNKWLAGEDDQWTGAMGLNGVSDQGQLAPGKSTSYTLYWQWPFEQGDDEYDTFLGNLAADEDVTYTIAIHTLASDAEAADGSGAGSDKNGGLFKTGDDTMIWIAALVLAIAGGLAVTLWVRRKKEQAEE